MRFTDLFIKRPVLAVAISLLILLLGVQAITKMQVRQYPKITSTVVTVTTAFPGASSDVVQGAISQPLAQAVAQADGIDFMTSSSAPGISTITAHMKINTDPNSALSDVLSQVNSVRYKLPSDAYDPTVKLSTGDSTSLMYIAFSSDKLTSPEITDYLERVVQPQFYSIDGIAAVNLFGGTQFAMHVWLDPKLMAAYDLTSSQVLGVLRSNNFQSSTGNITGYYTVYNGDAKTQVTDVEQLKKLIVSTHNGTVVHLRDIAKVTMSKGTDDYRALANGQPAVVLAMDPTPTANPLNITKDVTDLLPTIERNLPDAIQMRVMYDSTDSIRESIFEVEKTIFEAAAVVLVVIMLFMGSPRASLIPVITIPLSLIGVMLLMEMFGFSINLMTLLAMVLAIGLVVDDAIVVVENIDRHIKAGEPPFRGAIIGTREIAMPVITMTVTLAAVYAPVALMGGLTGSLFKEFALTLAGAVVISGIIALTLSPMMCSQLFRQNEQPGRLERVSHLILDRVTDRYSAFLDKLMQRRAVVVVFAILVFCSLPMLFKFIPSELAPSEDVGGFIVIASGPNTANLDYMQNNMLDITHKANAMESVKSVIGLAGVPNSNQGIGIVALKPWSERKESGKELVKQTNSFLADIPGIAGTAFLFPALPGGSGGLPVQFVLTSANDFVALYEVASDVLAKVTNNPLFVYSKLDLNYDSATIEIQINRDKAGAYGVSMQDIGTTLATMMSSGNVNRVNLNGRSYDVIPQVMRKDRLNPESLKNYYVQTSSGTQIPLGSLVSIKMVGKPRVLTQLNQLNSASISVVPAPGTSIGAAVNFFDSNVVPTLPKGYQYNYLGEARQYIQEGNKLYVTFFFAIIIIFLVLAAQFESLRDPLVILVSVPLAVCGALIVMAWGLATLNIYTQIGLVTLVGLITKHGILICEVAKEEQMKHGMNRMQAVCYAAKLRLRPILMTTAAMMAGLLPLLFAQGAGAVSRFDIGLTIIAGLGIGTLFTLFVLPVIYSYLASNHKPIQNFDESIPPKARTDRQELPPIN